MSQQGVLGDPLGPQMRKKYPNAQKELLEALRNADERLNARRGRGRTWICGAGIALDGKVLVPAAGGGRDALPQPGLILRGQHIPQRACSAWTEPAYQCSAELSNPGCFRGECR